MKDFVKNESVNGFGSKEIKPQYEALYKSDAGL